MKKFLVIAGLLSLAACDKPGSPTPPAKASAEASAVAVTDALAALKVEETKLLAEATGVVERTGSVLTLKADGVTVATFTDTDGNAWLYSGRFAGLEAGVSKQYSIFRLIEEHDSPHYSLIVDDSGTPVAWMGEDVLAHKGPLIASGSLASDGSYEGTFQIEDWSKPKHRKAIIEQPCLPDEWISATELRVKCFSPLSEKPTLETLSKTSDSTWTFGPNGTAIPLKAAEPFTADQREYAEKAGFKQLK